MANVVFLWHMHQPSYVDPATHTAVMPWVRLHSVKGYLDMISVIEDYPGIRLNFNLTPVLLLQIKELIDGKITDLWFHWSRIPAAELTEADRFALLENFFKIHWENLVRPHPRYWELLNKRGLTFYRDDVRRGLRYFSTQEMLDLQVWFNLAWCGYAAERRFPELAALKRKGRNFTEGEKQRVLTIHLECMRLVLRKYREAEERGQVELTTTPFFHPILPLIYDSALAERSLPRRQLPARYQWPQDAAAQLTLAVDQHAALFGQPPRGLWPSEGSIAPELIPLMSECGLEYFCSDEENLFHSLRRDTHSTKALDHLELFQGWRVEHHGASVNALFREKPLSDFIGFTAARKDPREAARHLLHHLRHISRQISLETGVIPLILDGENAWETFADGGESFLRHLYAGIQGSPDLLHSCTIHDYFEHHPPRRSITTLHTGSWIGSNFDLWIGEPEENRAWELLGETRAFLEGQIAGGQLDAEARCAALREIYAAEGSDWFWWYGPDFSTENDALFDDLFRQHLKNVYTLCHQLPPPVLDRPLLQALSAPLYTLPTAQLAPRIDGRHATYYEWSGAGEYRPAAEHGTRPRPERLLERLLFGSDGRHLYLRLDLRRWEPFQLCLDFQSPASAQWLSGEIHRGEAVVARFVGGSPEAGPVLETNPAGEEHPIFARDTVELAIPLGAFAAFSSDPAEPLASAISFQIRFLQQGVERERYPQNVPIQFAPPTEDSALAQWIV